MLRTGRILTAGMRVDPRLFPILVDAAGSPSGNRLSELSLSGIQERASGGVAYGGGTVSVATDDGGDRFRGVRGAAEEVLGGQVGNGGSAPAARRGTGADGAAPRQWLSPRMYGGFAFHPGEPADGAWEGFPVGRFTLPEWELRRENDEAWLLVHTDEAASPGGDRRVKLRERLDAIAGRLRAEADVRRDARSGAVTRTPSTSQAPTGASADSSDSVQRADGRPPAAWRAAVERALARIRQGRLDKVVLARFMDVLDEASPEEVFAALSAAGHGRSRYLLRSPSGAALVAASPETLVASAGRRVHTTAVAGSMPRGRDARSDESSARALLESDKDRREQAIVTDTLRQALGPVSRKITVRGPHLLRLAGILHLETRIEAVLPEPVHVLDLVARLHPTPAVCGRPRDEALGFIGDAEPFERGWYAGPVGWFDASGAGEFSPALRSAVGLAGRWRLFAGAGIVAGSDAEREWEETGLKLIPILGALGRTG